MVWRLQGDPENIEKSTPEGQEIDKNRKVEGKRAKKRAKRPKKATKRGQEGEKKLKKARAARGESEVVPKK